MFKNIKKKFKAFMTGKSGFSLVELIVVIAIMAVMAAVLAPALLGYVEKSRMQKDDSAMDEVVNAMYLNLADQDVYDELLRYSCEQYSCYVDSDSPDAANKVEIKPGKYYMYSDEERQLDETAYQLDGLMRGVTITFAPASGSPNEATIDLAKGQLNKYMPSSAKTYGGLNKPQCTDVAIGEKSDATLYHWLRSVVGNTIKLSSQTYRNSEYTIFVSMGTTGGNQADMQDAIQIWGQWSGTNLEPGSNVAMDTSNKTNPSEGQIVVTAPEVKTIPADRKLDTVYTWAELSAIAKTGEAQTTYGLKLGDTIAVNDYRVRIIGFNHDGQNTITWMTTTVLESPVISGKTTGGYANSELKTYLNGTVYNTLPSDLKSVITPVTKLVDKGWKGNARDEVIEDSNNYLFALSLDELWGDLSGINYCHLKLGTRYAYFAQKNDYGVLNLTSDKIYYTRTSTWNVNDHGENVKGKDRFYYVLSSYQCGNTDYKDYQSHIAYAFVI